MTENYDTATLAAIVAEAKRRGFPDELIANHLGIGNNDPAFGYQGEDQLRATIKEYLHRGIHRLGIAERMSLTLADVVRLEGDPYRRIGLYGDEAFAIWPGEPHSEENVLRFIEEGEKRLGHAKGRRLSAKCTLALLVRAVGLEGTRSIIAEAIRICEDRNAVIGTLNIPREAADAVLCCSFPAETTRTLQ